jgi:hypothetical protein
MNMNRKYDISTGTKVSQHFSDPDPDPDFGIGTEFPADVFSIY